MQIYGGGEVGLGEDGRKWALFLKFELG